MINDEVIDRLVSIRDLDTNEKCDEFIKTLLDDSDESYKAGSLEMSDIPKLCRIFHDYPGCDELMDSLMHLIEDIPGEKSEYNKYIAIAVPAMIDAPVFAMTLVQRIMYSDDYYAEFPNVICNLKSEEKQEFIDFLLCIKSRYNNSYGDLVDELMSKIE